MSIIWEWNHITNKQYPENICLVYSSVIVIHSSEKSEDPDTTSSSTNMIIHPSYFKTQTEGLHYFSFHLINPFSISHLTHRNYKFPSIDQRILIVGRSNWITVTVLFFNMPLLQPVQFDKLKRPACVNLSTLSRQKTRHVERRQNPMQYRLQITTHSLTDASNIYFTFKRLIYQLIISDGHHNAFRWKTLEKKHLRGGLIVIVLLFYIIFHSTRLLKTSYSIITDYLGHIGHPYQFSRYH